MRKSIDIKPKQSTTTQFVNNYDIVSPSNKRVSKPKINHSDIRKTFTQDIDENNDQEKNEEDKNQKQQKSVRVFCRFRPLNKAEKDLNSNGVGNICCRIDQNSVKVGDDNKFKFDGIFDQGTEQSLIFDKISKKSLNDVLNGFNATLFCYGQTGSGKTFTMYGLDVKKELELGIIPRSIAYIFQQIANNQDPDVEFDIQYSMLEIYMEKLMDLLNHTRDNLQIKENPKKGIYVEGLQSLCVASYQESMDLLELGQNNKSIAQTKMNSQSSRAHTIFIVQIKQRFQDGSQKLGVLNLIDLAGSEKISRTGAEGETLEQAKKINLSLTSLGSVINALTTNKDHVPYRNSKLTRLLQESLGGNYKTTLIVNASLHSSSMDETLSTLRFGQRAKTIKTNVKINVIHSPEKMEKTINELRLQLKIKDKIIESKGFYNIESYQFDLQKEDNKENEFYNKLIEIQQINEELEQKNEKSEEKLKNFENNWLIQIMNSKCISEDGTFIDYIKDIAVLTQERDSYKNKLQQIQFEHDLLSKQQICYQQQIQQLRNTINICEIRELNTQSDFQKLLQTKIKDFLRENFQKFYEKNVRQFFKQKKIYY